MGPQLMFAAVQQIVTAFTADFVGRQLAGFPSTDYKVHTIMTHAFDYGYIRYEMGYASAICFVLFIARLQRSYPPSAQQIHGLTGVSVENVKK